MKHTGRTLGATCYGKVPYGSKGAALKRVEAQMDRHRVRRRTNWGKRVMKAYHCPFCHSWHVGGSDESAEAAKQWRQRDQLAEEIFQSVPDALLARLGWGR